MKTHPRSTGGAIDESQRQKAGASPGRPNPAFGSIYDYIEQVETAMIDQELVAGNAEFDKRDGDTQSEVHKSRALSSSPVKGKRTSSVMEEEGRSIHKNIDSLISIQPIRKYRNRNDA